MKLAKIHIKNFRSIQNSEIRFDEITALVGENNAGKSAILRAINAIFNYSLEQPYFIDNTHQYAPKTTTTIVLYFQDFSLEKYFDICNADQLKLCFKYSYSKTKRGRSLYFDTANGKINADPYMEALKQDIGYIYIPANRGQSDLIWSEQSIFTQLVSHYLEEYTKNKDLLSNKVIDVSKQIYNQILRRLGKELTELHVLDNDASYDVNFINNLDYSIYLDKLSIFIKDHDITFPALEYGSGINSLTVIALYRLLIKNSSSSVILGIEEPESHLHPQAQKQFISSLLLNRKDYENQAILATHSTVIIDALQHQNIVLVRKVTDPKRGYKTITSQLPENFWNIHHINDYKHYVYFQYRNSDFFFAKYVIITESSTDAQVVESLIKDSLKDKMYSVSILNLTGVQNLRYPYYLLKDLNIPFTVIVDKDFFLPYLHDSLDRSRDANYLPLYKVKAKRNDLVINSCWPNEKIKELDEYLNKSYSSLFDYLKTYSFCTMEYSLEMDLIAKSSQARDMYYDHFNLNGGNRNLYNLLHKKDAVKNPTLLMNIFLNVTPSNRPYSYKKIRKYLIEEINKYIE